MEAPAAVLRLSPVRAGDAAERRPAGRVSDPIQGADAGVQPAEQPHLHLRLPDPHLAPAAVPTRPAGRAPDRVGLSPERDAGVDLPPAGVAPGHVARADRDDGRAVPRVPDVGPE